jgi:ABC-type phosphate transport system auxiliary subunit
MNAGALSQSVIMTIGLIFLILIDYDRLSEFFFKAQSNILSISSVKLSTKTILRIAGVLLPVLYICYQATH